MRIGIGSNQPNRPHGRVDSGHARRRGAVAALVVVSLVVLLGMAALTIDVGMMYRARAEAQASADSAALAGALRLLDSDRLTGSPSMSEIIEAARTTAAQYAAMNEVVNSGPQVDLSSDVLVGRLENPWNPNENLSFGDPNQYNTVRVLVRRNEASNGPIQLFFAGILGRSTADVSAEAFATLNDEITGFRPNDQSGNSNVLPFALHEDDWTALLSGAFSVGDNWSFDPTTGTVSAGADGINELDLFPEVDLPSGNFGTVDIGGSNNSTSDLSRQIREGISPQDIAALGFDLVLGSDGTLTLNGNTGISAGTEDDLKSIVGLPRTIPLFRSVANPGNNAQFVIVGFAGIVILDVKLTGSLSKKRVMIQPAFVVDSTAVVGGPGDVAGSGDFVYRPVELVR